MDCLRSDRASGGPSVESGTECRTRWPMEHAAELSSAVWAGDLKAVDALIAAGADVNVSDGEGRQPLHLVIEQQWVEIVQRLIAAGAEVNRDLGDGWTPLAHAIDIECDGAAQNNREPSTQLTEALLKAGAIPTERASALAAFYRNEKALALLRRYAAGPKEK